MKLRFFLLLTTLLTLPFATRKILWSGSAPYFTEYIDVSIFAYEIFLLGYVALSILEHKIYFKSIYKRMFHVEHVALLFLVTLSTLLAAFFDDRFFGLYFLIRWVVYILFAVCLYQDLKLIVPRGTIAPIENEKKCSTWNTLYQKLIKLFHVEHLLPLRNSQNCSTWNNLRLILWVSLIFQAILVLIQVYLQKSLGLIYLGESILDVSISGVATIIANGKEYLRGYGTFLHPNITAYFFFVYGLALILMTIVPRGTLLKQYNTLNCSTWNNWIINKCDKLFHVEQSLFRKILKIVPRGTIWLTTLFILGSFTLTFSKSVIFVALLIGIFVIYSINCSTWNNCFSKICLKLFHVEQSRMKRIAGIVPCGTIWILVIVVIIGGFLRYSTYLPPFIQQSILERKLQYLSIPIDTPIELLAGQGLGSYTQMLAEKSPGLYFWQLQPIHNTFILWIFEIGLLPLIIVFLYLLLASQNYSKKFGKLNTLSLHQKRILFIGGASALLLLVDHYTWDIEQGQFLFIFLSTILVFFFRFPISKKEK